MKICQYINRLAWPTQPRLAVLEEPNDLLDLNLIWQAYYEVVGRYNPIQRAKHKMPSTLSCFLSIAEAPIEQIKETLEIYSLLVKQGYAETIDGSPLRISLEENPNVQLTKPIDRIPTYRDFYAFEEHVKKGFQKRKEAIPKEWYEIPAYYKGNTHSFYGPGDPILWPSYSQKLDYELELAVVMAQDGENIPEEKAMQYVLGFTILNDISARDIQKKEMAIRLGPAKGKDFCSLIGPVITTIDEFDNKEPDLLMTAKVNGEEWSRGQSGDAHYSFSQMIAHASRDEWVLAGDLMGSGTVGTGCGLELDKWIQPEDELDLFIENIGHLVNIVTSK